MTVAYLDDIDRVQYKFTELGQTIESLSSQHTGYFEDTIDSLSTGFDELKTMFADSEFKTAHDAAGVLDSRVSEMSDLFGKVLSQVSASFSVMMTTSKDAHTGIAKIADALKTATEQPSAQVGGAPAVPDAEKKGKKRELPKVLKKEIGTLKSSTSSMMGKLKIPKPGNIMAGGIMMMAYGFMYKDRVQKEVGEIKNTLESAFDYGIKGVRNKGVAAFSALQEDLQRYVGISKGEVQAITQTFAQGGVGITEMQDDVHNKWGRVGKSAVHSALALDKMFGVPGGTMAQKAVSYMHNYGMSLKEANEMTRDLHLNDQAFKIGVPTFVQNVENAAESLKDLGFSIRGVMDVAGGLQEQFEKIGLPKQFAGKMAGVGVQQMAQGIASMSDDWKVFMGQKMSGGRLTGLDALQKFEEGFTRVKEGGGVEEYKNFILIAYQVAKEVSEGDEAEMYMLLSRRMEQGPAGARATMEIGKVFEEEGGIAAVKATKDHMKTFKSAFETEREADSKFRQKMNAWMEGISEVGQGLLGLVGKALAYLVALFRAYPSMFGAMINQDWKRLGRIQRQVMALTKGGEHDIVLLKSGFKKMGKAGKEMFGDVFSSTADALDMAFTGDLSGEDAPKPKDRPIELGEARVPIVQTVYIPMESQAADQTYPVRVKSAAAKKAVQLAREGKMEWRGGGLSIVSRGVDEHGNIGLDLVGSCPRCGLIFGGGKSGMQGEAAAGSSTFEGVNTGRTMPIDLDSGGALKQVRDVSLTGNMRRKIEKAGKSVKDLDPQLLPLFQNLSEQYKGKDIKVYKSLGAGDKTHGQGKAVDISVKGVKPQDLYKHLRSEGYGKTHGGLGYYPKLPFVHVDVRDKPATWVDTSGSGEESQNVKTPVAWLQQNIGLDEGQG